MSFSHSHKNDPDMAGAISKLQGDAGKKRHSGSVMKKFSSSTTRQILVGMYMYLL